VCTTRSLQSRILALLLLCTLFLKSCHFCSFILISSLLSLFVTQAAEPTGNLGSFNPFPSTIFLAQSITWFIYGCAKVREEGRVGRREQR